MVPCRVTDVVQIVMLAACTHTELTRGCTLVVCGLSAGQRVFELNHAGDGEKQRRVISRHQRRGRENPMILRLEVSQVRTTYVGRLHVAVDELKK